MMLRNVSVGFYHSKHIVGQKNITDVINDERTSPKTDKFIEKCGTKALLKIISMLPGRDVEKIEFEDIKTVITDYI